MDRSVSNRRSQKSPPRFTARLVVWYLPAQSWRIFLVSQGFVELVELNRSFAPVQKALGKRRMIATVNVKRQIAGGWRPQQRMLLRPIPVSIDAESLFSSSWMSTSDVEPAFDTALAALTDVASKSSLSALSSFSMDNVANSSRPKLPPVHPPPPPGGFHGWAPFERPPLKPDRPAMRLGSRPVNALSSLQSSRPSLRRSTMSASSLRLKRDLDWFRSSLAGGKLPQSASASQLLPLNSMWSQGT
jgi:hypothetical protein